MDKKINKLFERSEFGNLGFIMATKYVFLYFYNFYQKLLECELVSGKTIFKDGDLFEDFLHVRQKVKEGKRMSVKDTWPVGLNLGTWVSSPCGNQQP